MRIMTNEKLLYIGRIIERTNWSFPSHHHPNWSEIIFVVKGEGVVTISGERYAVQEGDLLVYNQGIIHEEYSSTTKPLETYYCGISHPDRSLLIPLENRPIIKTKQNRDTIELLFSLIYEESQQQREDFQEASEYLLMTLMIWVRRLSELELSTKRLERDSESLAIRIKDYLDLNYLRHISLNDIANAFHMNAYYLSHVFRSKYNDSPINYILNRRMGEAKQLLVQTTMKVSEIAQLLGYENTNYFTILFKRIMRESPSQFRKREWKERINL